MKRSSRSRADKPTARAGSTSSKRSCGPCANARTESVRIGLAQVAAQLAGEPGSLANRLLPELGNARVQLLERGEHLRVHPILLGGVWANPSQDQPRASRRIDRPRPPTAIGAGPCRIFSGSAESAAGRSRAASAGIRARPVARITSSRRCISSPAAAAEWVRRSSSAAVSSRGVAQHPDHQTPYASAMPRADIGIGPLSVAGPGLVLAIDRNEAAGARGSCCRASCKSKLPE